MDTPYSITEWKFIFPARPEKKIPPALLSFYEQLGWWGQVKKEGTCATIGVDPKGGVHAFTRHRDKPLHKAWSFTDETRKIADFCPSGEWSVFGVELLHSKGPFARDTFYIWDLFGAASAFLVGKTFADRQSRLTKMFPDPIGETDSHYVMTDKIWLAKPIVRDLEGAWERLKAAKSPEDEGIVLKNPLGELEPLYREHNNSSWQVKCRLQDKGKRIGF
jgi:hypothetical protein